MKNKEGFCPIRNTHNTTTIGITAKTHIKTMGKSIGLVQLAQKVYVLLTGLSEEFKASIGEIEDSWDAIIYGASGNGKTNFTVMLLKALMLAMDCKCEYVSYEEGHAKTIKDTMITRHNMLEAVGNKMIITDHLTYDQLFAKMGKKQSAKIWVIDSLQASAFTYKQCQKLKETYVLSRKKKIILYISWSEGKTPQGAVGKAVEYYANIKMKVEGLVMFPKSRYGGNKPFVIWEEGAKRYWGDDYEHKVLGLPKGKKKPKPKAKKPIHNSVEPAEPVTKMQVAEPSPPVFKD